MVPSESANRAGPLEAILWPNLVYAKGPGSKCEVKVALRAGGSGLWLGPRCYRPQAALGVYDILVTRRACSARRETMRQWAAK